MTRLADLKALFLDIQTTGASPKHGAMLEIAWCVAAGSSVEGEARVRSFVLTQEAPLPRRIAKITGLTEEDLASAVVPGEALGILQREMAEAGVAVAHFARFEAAFLQPAWREFTGEGFPLEMLCTHVLCKKLLPTLPSFSLRAVAGSFGWVAEQPRRGATHVLATLAVWRGLCRVLEERENIQTLEDLEAWLQQPKKKGVKRQRTYQVNRELRLALPKGPGIYQMLGAGGQVLYVGKATSLKERVNSYFRTKKGHSTSKFELLAQVHSVEVEATETVLEAALLESDLIKRLDPPYNIALRLGARVLHHYDRNLLLCEAEESLYGPFPGRGGLHVPVLLAVALNAGDLLTDLTRELFYAEVDDGVWREGLASFAAEHGLAQGVTPRRLLALGLRLYRALPSPEEAETSDFEETAADEEVGEVTAEIVRERLGYEILNAGHRYMVAREIRRLACSEVCWQEKGRRWRCLRLQGGQIISRRWDDEPAPEEPATGRATPSTAAPALSPMDVTTYDRLRVLRTELRRVAIAYHLGLR